MQFFKLSTFVYASFLLAPIAASNIPKSHLARHQPLTAELDLVAAGSADLSLRQSLPLVNLNLNKVLNQVLENVTEELTKASVVGDLVKSVTTQLKSSLTNIFNSLKPENIDTVSIDEIKTSVETIVQGLDQLATAIRDFGENELVDRLLVGTIGKETVTILTSLFADFNKAIKSIENTLDESKLPIALSPLKDLVEPLEELSNGFQSLLKTLPSSITKSLKNLESSVQIVVSDVL